MSKHDEDTLQFVTNLVALRGGNIQAYNKIAEKFHDIAEGKLKMSAYAKDDVDCRWLQGEAKAWSEVFTMFKEATATLEKLKNPKSGGMN